MGAGGVYWGMQKPNSPRTRLRSTDPVAELWLLVTALFAVAVVALAALSMTISG